MIHIHKHMRKTGIFRGLPGLASMAMYFFLSLKWVRWGISSDFSYSKLKLRDERVWKLQSETHKLKKLYYKNSIWLPVITCYCYFHMTIQWPDLAILSDRNNFYSCESTPQSQDCKIKTVLIMEMNTNASEIPLALPNFDGGLKETVDFFWIARPWKL